jgi:hypothetical protein
MAGFSGSELIDAGLINWWSGRMILPDSLTFAPPEDLWWRAELDLWGHGDGVNLIFTPYEVVRTTLRGVWLDTRPGKRFVRGDAVRQFATPTIELAVHDLSRRLLVRERHLSRQLAEVRAGIMALQKTREWKRYGRTTEDQPGQDPPAVAATLLGFAGDGH